MCQGRMGGGYEWPAYGIPICLTWQTADGIEKLKFYRWPNMIAHIYMYFKVL